MSWYITRSIAAAAGLHRLAITAAPPGPTPSIRYTVEERFFFKIVILSRLSHLGRTLRHAMNAGCSPRSAPSTSTTVSLDIRHLPSGRRADLPVLKISPSPRRRSLRRTDQAPAFDLQLQVTVLECLRAMGNHESGAAA